MSVYQPPLLNDNSAKLYSMRELQRDAQVDVNRIIEYRKGKEGDDRSTKRKGQLSLPHFDKRFEKIYFYSTIVTLPFLIVRRPSVLVTLRPIKSTVIAGRSTLVASIDSTPVIVF